MRPTFRRQRATGDHDDQSTPSEPPPPSNDADQTAATTDADTHERRSWLRENTLIVVSAAVIVVATLTMVAVGVGSKLYDNGREEGRDDAERAWLWKVDALEDENQSLRATLGDVNESEHDDDGEGHHHDEDFDDRWHEHDDAYFDGDYDGERSGGWASPFVAPPSLGDIFDDDRFESDGFGFGFGGPFADDGMFGFDSEGDGRTALGVMMLMLATALEESETGDGWGWDDQDDGNWYDGEYGCCDDSAWGSDQFGRPILPSPDSSTQDDIIDDLLLPFLGAALGDVEGVTPDEMRDFIAGLLDYDTTQQEPNVAPSCVVWDDERGYVDGWEIDGDCRSLDVQRDTPTPTPVPTTTTVPEGFCSSYDGEGNRFEGFPTPDGCFPWGAKACHWYEPGGNRVGGYFYGDDGCRPLSLR